VKPQRVKECTQGLHNKQDTNRGKDEDDATDNKGENIVKPTRNNCISESAKMFILMARETSLLTPMPLVVLYRRIHWTTRSVQDWKENICSSLVANEVKKMAR
jgi:hypothetical protein